MPNRPGATGHLAISIAAAALACASDAGERSAAPADLVFVNGGGCVILLHR